MDNSRSPFIVRLLFSFLLLFSCTLICQAVPLQLAKKTIRFGIVTFYNPRLMILRYQPFVDALSERSEFKFELVLTTSYSQTVDLLETGEIDLAYLGPVTFLRAYERYNATPLVKLNTDGKPTFRSVIAVKEGSSIKNISDLKGKTFAFGSPLSTSSHLYPRIMLKEEGVELGDLSEFVYYRRHDSAARAVLKGEADACGIRDVVAKRYAERGLRVLAQSDPIPNFPIVASPRLEQNMISDLREIFLSLDPASPSDSSDIAQWDEELRQGFVPASVADYIEVRRELIQLFGKKAFTGDLAAPGAKQTIIHGQGFAP